MLIALAQATAAAPSTVNIKIAIVLIVTFAIIAVLALAALGFVCVTLYWILQEQQTAKVSVKDAAANMLIAAEFLWTFFLLYLWRYRYRVKHYMPVLAMRLFRLAGIFTIIQLLWDICEYLFGRYGSALPKPNPAGLELLKSLREHVSSFFRHPYVLVLLLAIEILLYFHHKRDAKHHKRGPATVALLGNVFLPLTELLNLLDSAPDPATAKASVTEFMKWFADLLAEIIRIWGVVDANICIMACDYSTSKIVYLVDSSAGTDFGNKVTIDFGQGVAGACVAKQKTIYVPNKRYRHGVIVEASELVPIPSVYYDGIQHPFKSILSVPILIPDASNRLKCVGVLNLSSPRSSAFSETDFAVGFLGSKILGLIPEW